MVFALVITMFGSSFSYATTGSTKSNIYTTEIKTTLYNEANSNSKKIEVWYNTKLKLLSKKTSSAGTWSKVKFRGNVYYLWTAKGQKKYSKTSKVKKRKKYLSYCKTDLQKKVVKEAFRIYRKWDTAYDFDKKFSDGTKKNGKYFFHCSGYATYVVNKVAKKQAPPYYVTSDTEKLASTGYILNEGIKGQVKAKTICKGKLNFKKLQPGDILFFKVMDDDPRKIDHVAIYIGNKQIIESTRYTKGVYTNKGYDKDGGVCIAPLKGMYKTGFVKAVRLLPKKFYAANITKKVKKTSAIFKDSNCENENGDKIYVGDSVTILYTYRTSTGKHNAYISYGDGKTGYLYLYKEKLK